MPNVNMNAVIERLLHEGRASVTVADISLHPRDHEEDVVKVNFCTEILLRDWAEALGAVPPRNQDHVSAAEQPVAADEEV